MSPNEENGGIFGVGERLYLIIERYDGDKCFMFTECIKYHRAFHEYKCYIQSVMNPIQNIQQGSSCNLPTFFTGLAEKKVNNESKKPLLCFLCGSSLSNNVKNKDSSQTQNDCNVNCENCERNFHNLKEALSLLSKISSLPATPSTSVPPIQSREVNVNTNIPKRKSLLPHPEQSNTTIDSQFSPPVTEIFQNRNTKEDFDARNGVSPNLKRKNDFPHSNSKRSRNSIPPNVFHHASDHKSFERLEKCMWDLYMESKQTEIVYNQKMALREKLHEILLTTIPTCGLYVVGSSMTGLGAKSSDMDMCLMLTDAEIDQEKEATNILHTVHDVFSNISFLKDVQVIYAKVPILRFTDCISGIDVDLNVNNAVGIRNTQLLSSYARIDERFPPLVLVVKMWARYHGINDAKNNTLSSYSLVLMVIHYLQYACKPPVLPCLQKLQPDKYLPKSDVRKLKLREVLPNFTSENNMSLGDLFVGFLSYFAYEFDYFRSVMSVRLGNILPKEVAMNNTFSSKNKKAHWKFVCVEEPFDLTNTACAVFKPGVFRYMMQVFKDSCETVSKTSDLSSIM